MYFEFYFVTDLAKTNYRFENVDKNTPWLNDIEVSVSEQGNLSRIVRKRDYCLCENKGADQLRGNREADQRLCFRYSDSTIPLLLKSEISSFYLFSELVQAGLCRTWSKTPKTGFLASWLISLSFD